MYASQHGHPIYTDKEENNEYTYNEENFITVILKRFNIKCL